MREVPSAALQNAEPVPLGGECGTLDLYDGLTTPYSQDSVILSERHKEQIEAFVETAAENYAAEPTLAQEKFGIPSLVVRVDCTVGPEGDILPYEMEDSPSGQGITDALHKAAGGPGIRDDILEHYEAMLGEPPTVIVSRARNHGTDDILIVGGDRYVNGSHTPEALRLAGPVIVKAIPGVEASRLPYMRLQDQAVAPLETEGDKAYAERIGLMDAAESQEDLLADAEGNLRSQVVKAQLGSMALGVSIYLSAADRKRFGRAGTVSASRLVRDLTAYNEQSGALVQEFIPPIQIENDEGRTNAILRVFALLERQSGRITAQAVGGCYVARNEVLLHGATNAVSGAILVE